MNPINPLTLETIIRATLKNRPLWRIKTVEDFFDLPREKVLARIDNGEFFWAFNIGLGRSRDIRILGYSVMEKHMGPFTGIGETKKLDLPAVINLILPSRDVRSTELRRRFSCNSNHVYGLARDNFKVTRKAEAKDGPKAFTVFSRASVENFLIRRRII